MSIRTLSQQKLTTQVYNKTKAALLGHASVAFNGSQKSTINKNTGLAIGTADFCVEFWYKAASTSGSGFWFSGDNPGGEFAGISIGYTSGQYWYLLGTGTSWTTQRSIGSVSSNTWRHVALTRNAGAYCKFFVDGVALDSWTDANNFSQPSGSTLWAVGGATGYMTNGSISNLRVVKSNAVYTSAFTVPTSPLTAISGTSLLTCNSSTTIADSSGNCTFASTAGTPGTANPFV